MKTKNRFFSDFFVQLKIVVSLRHRPRSSKLTRLPRSYGRSMQPIYKKISYENKFSLNFLAYLHFLLYLCTLNVEMGRITQ